MGNKSGRAMDGADGDSHERRYDLSNVVVYIMTMDRESTSTQVRTRIHIEPAMLAKHLFFHISSG